MITFLNSKRKKKIILKNFENKIIRKEKIIPQHGMSEFSDKNFFKLL